MTDEDLWEPDEVLGTPIRAGEWLYDGRVPLAVRLFRSGTLYGSGDEEDPPEVRDVQSVVCYCLELQVAGEERWCSRRTFLTLEEVERFGTNDLNGSLRWHDR